MSMDLSNMFDVVEFRIKGVYPCVVASNCNHDEVDDGDFD